MNEVNEEGGSRRLVGWFNFEKSGKLIWFSKTPISPLSASTLSSLSFLVGTYNSFLFEAPRSEEGDKRYDNCYGAGHLIVSDGLLQGVHHLIEVALQALRHARHHPLHLGRYVVVIFVTWPVTKTLFFQALISIFVIILSIFVGYSHPCLRVAVVHFLLPLVQGCW